MKIYLTQHYLPNHVELFNLTSPINLTYANANKYIYVSNSTPRCPDRKVWWEKIAWIKEFLNTIEDGSLVSYQDCDSINISGDLESALGGKEYGMVQLRQGSGGEQLMDWFNAGVIIMINTPDVRAYFDRVWTRNDDTDETSMNKELKSNGWGITINKPICSLDAGWNCWKNNEHFASGIKIKSWHGMSYNDKVIDIKKYLNK